MHDSGKRVEAAEKGHDRGAAELVTTLKSGDLTLHRAAKRVALCARNMAPARRDRSSDGHRLGKEPERAWSAARRLGRGEDAER
jgi:hypothetical protein